MRILAVFAALAFIVAVPFALKPEDDLLAEADDTIVVITPHNEQIRYEFSRAFGDYYKRETGRTVRIDWRMPGGTSEIARYIRSEYYAAFEQLWKSSGREWTAEAATTFDDPKAQTEARREFLASNASIGIDLFFGEELSTFNSRRTPDGWWIAGLSGNIPTGSTTIPSPTTSLEKSFTTMPGVGSEPFFPLSGSVIIPTPCGDFK